MQRSRGWALVIGALGFITISFASAQTAHTLSQTGAPPKGTFRVQGNKLEAIKRATDLGSVDDEMVMTNLSVHLRRPADRQAALDNLIDQQKNPRSPNYRLWLTPAQLDSIYGPDAAKRTALSGWLRSKGMQNVHVTAGGMDIKFDATARLIRNTFATSIHRYSLAGETHIANAEGPSLPLQFESIVSGVYPLHDFKPKSQVHQRNELLAKTPAPDGARPQLTLPYQGARYDIVTPADFAQIYNVRPAWAAGITGLGQTVTVAADSDILPSDWQSFRSQLGLAGYAGALSITHPGCAAPFQVPAKELEAALDAEWASVAAPDANIQLASCPDDATTAGGITAIEHLLNGSSPPAIVSFSFGTCEIPGDTNTTNFVNDLWQQAAAEGTSVFVASGDGSSAWCDQYSGNPNTDGKVHSGVSVNAFAISPYAVAVGGTTFTTQLTGQEGQYWDLTRSTAGNNYQSALSYVPEMAWNDTCGNPIQAASWGYPDVLSFCNNLQFLNAYPSWLGGTTGGNSINNTHTPSWQVGVPGAPVTGTRGIPDVALVSGGFSGGVYLITCMSDTNANGVPCDYTQDQNVAYSAYSGTSFSAPAFAGIQALINQKLGTRQGNPNYALYQIGRLEFGAGSAGFGSTQTCSSALGSSVASNCVFIDTTIGGNAVPCAPGTANCFSNSGQSTGVTSQSTLSFQPAFSATPGWDYTTGLGTVNVANLVNAMATVDTYVASGYVDGDINGDKNADVFFQGAGFNELGRWILHRGEISHVVEEPSAANDHVAAVGDLDGDGKADLVWQRSDGTVTVWLSRGEGAYQKSSPGVAPVGSNAVAAVDTDGDGFADIVLVNPTTQLVTVWRMLGASKVQTWTESLAAGVVIHGSGDFDKDGLDDLAVTSGGNVSLLLSLPGGNFTTTALGAMPAGSTLMGAEDINGDGSRDLVFVNATTGAVTVWFMQDAVHKTTASWTLPAGETLVGLGDFDGDGHTDVLTENQARHLSFWSQLPSGTFSEESIGLDSPTAAFVPTRWSVVAAQTH